MLCRLCSGPALSERRTCAACAPVFQKWIRKKRRLRSANNRRRLARLVLMTRPCWGVV